MFTRLRGTKQGTVWPAGTQTISRTTSVLGYLCRTPGQAVLSRISESSLAEVGRDKAIGNRMSPSTTVRPVAIFLLLEWGRQLGAKNGLAAILRYLRNLLPKTVPVSQIQLNVRIVWAKVFEHNDWICC